jgi:hypothetical protein
MHAATGKAKGEGEKKGGQLETLAELAAPVNPEQSSNGSRLSARGCEGGTQSRGRHTLPGGVATVKQELYAAAAGPFGFCWKSKPETSKPAQVHAAAAAGSSASAVTSAGRRQSSAAPIPAAAASPATMSSPRPLSCSPTAAGFNGSPVIG